jgi:hypothetical protein
VDIYTPEDDASIRDLTATALAAYRARDWETSEAAWRDILERRADDGVAAHYLQMIGTLRHESPAPAWDGAEALDKL